MAVREKAWTWRSGKRDEYGVRIPKTNVLRLIFVRDRDDDDTEKDYFFGVEFIPSRMGRDSMLKKILIGGLIAFGALAGSKAVFGQSTICNLTNETVASSTDEIATAQCPGVGNERLSLGELWAGHDTATSYSGVGACGANQAATTLNDEGAPTCTEFTELGQEIELSTETSGNYMVNVLGGDGMAVTHTPGEGSTATILTNSQKDNFLRDGGVTSLVCATNPGHMQVMDDGDLEWCDGAATPALQSVDAKIATHTAIASAHHVQTPDQVGTVNNGEFCQGGPGSVLDCDVAGALADDDLSDDLPTALSNVTTINNTQFCVGNAGGGFDCTTAGTLADDDLSDDSITALSGVTGMTAELFVDANGAEFEAGDALTDCSTFVATNGGIFYDDSEGKFKKCEDNVLTDLDTGGGGGEANTISSQGGATALTAATPKSGVDLRIVSANATRFSVSTDVLDIASVAGITGANEDDLSDDLPTALSNVTTITNSQFCVGNAGGGFDCTTAGPAFNTITSGTNTTATMTVGSGAVILPASGGIIEATETVTEVYNNTGATIEKCAAVFISGFNVGAGLPEVTVADADTVDDGNPAIGLVQAAITTATAGYVAVGGEITGVDTSVAEAWSEGDILYVNTNGPPAATADCQETLTNVKPTGSGVGIQNIAVVGRTHGSLGTVEIHGSGRANDLPNIADDSTWVGSTTGVPTAEALPDTDADGQALGWDQSTNAFSNVPNVGSSVDISTESNLAAGAHLTLSGDSVEADASLSTHTKTVAILNPTTGEDGLIRFVLSGDSSTTITKFWCDTDTATVTVNLEERAETTPNTAGTDVATSDVVCDTNSQTASLSNTGIDLNDPLAVMISAAGAAGVVNIHVRYTVDE
jgi:hypothetical protein